MIYFILGVPARGGGGGGGGRLSCEVACGGQPKQIASYY